MKIQSNVLQQRSLRETLTIKETFSFIPLKFATKKVSQYATLYEYFRNIAEFTDTLIIIGYAFRDEPINRIVANFMKNGKKCIVISPTVAQDILTFNQFGH